MSLVTKMVSAPNNLATGAMAAALSQGFDLLTAVRRGVAAGTLAVTREGTQDSYPTAGELVSS